MGIICKGGRTKQSFRDECDINKLMTRYVKTGRLPDLIRKNPIYGDFSKAVDLQSAYAVVEKAELQFRELSAEVRKRFDNDPVKFMAFVEDPANIREMIDMGLAVEKKPDVVVNNELPGTGTPK